MCHLDISEALRSVNHRLPPNELEPFGILWQVNKCAKIFPIRRTFCARIRRRCLPKLGVTNGSLQGPVLGLLLWMHFANDLALSRNLPGLSCRQCRCARFRRQGSIGSLLAPCNQELFDVNVVWRMRDHHFKFKMDGPASQGRQKTGD